MTSTSIWRCLWACAERLRQRRVARVAAEALIWHHGYKGLDAALKAVEAPTGNLREDVRADLVARFAADRYLRFIRPRKTSDVVSDLRRSPSASQLSQSGKASNPRPSSHLRKS